MGEPKSSTNPFKMGCGVVIVIIIALGTMPFWGPAVITFLIPIVCLALLYGLAKFLGWCFGTKEEESADTDAPVTQQSEKGKAAIAGPNRKTIDAKPGRSLETIAAMGVGDLKSLTRKELEMFIEAHNLRIEVKSGMNNDAIRSAIREAMKASSGKGQQAKEERTSGGDVGERAEAEEVEIAGEGGPIEGASDDKRVVTPEVYNEWKRDGQWGRCLEMARRAFGKNPDNDDVCIEYAFLLCKVEGAQSARTALDLYVAGHEPSSLPILYNLACYECLCGESEKALLRVRALIKKDPSILARALEDSDLEAIREDLNALPK